MAKTKKKVARKKKKPVKKPARKKKTIRSRAVKYVWRIYRYLQRFEMPDDMRGFRESPPQFVKAYVGDGHNLESIGHQAQMKVLRASQNKKGLRYMYAEVLEIAAYTTRCYRGYVLNAKLQPATDPEIAARAGLPVAETRRLLKELAVIGFIERVPMPAFDPDGIKPPKDKKAGKKTKKKAKKKAKKKRRVRSTPGRSGAARSALRAKTESGKTKVKSNSEIGKEGKIKKEVSKKKNKSAAAQQKGDPKKKDLKAKPGNGREKIKGPKLARQGKGVAEATHPISPTGSDAGGQKRVSTPAKPPPSCPAAAIARRFDKLYDPTSKSFAMLIYEKMEVPHRPTSLKGKQELGNFATAWTNAQRAGLTPSVLARLWDSAEADAVSMAKKRRRLKFKKSPEAVWRSLFNKRLNAAIARIPDNKPATAAV